MKARLTFKCWNEKCKRTYSLFKEITDEQELIVACPFCRAEAVVRLDPFKQDKKSVFKGDGDDAQALGHAYHFPDVIPTEKPA